MSVPRYYPASYDPQPPYTDPTPGKEPCEECFGEYFPSDMFDGPRKTRLCSYCVPRCGHITLVGLVLAKCDEPSRPGSEGGYCLFCDLEVTRDGLEDALKDGDTEMIALYLKDCADLELKALEVQK
jgi:hypothetical protein